MSSGTSSKPAKTAAARLLAIVFLIAAIALGWLYWRSQASHPLSEDAVIQADVVHVSTPTPGRVQAFHVKDGDAVAKGDLLYELDDQTYHLRLEAARAELRMAEAALASRQRGLKAEQSNADIADQQIERARANLALATQTVERLRPMATKGYVTAQQLDDARTLQRDAQISLGQAEAQALAANDLIGDLRAAEAAVDAQRNVVALAERALQDTRVHAPLNGRIVGLRTAPGQYLAPDQSPFTLVDTDHWYATAFFRETELHKIATGMCAVVYVMAQPSVAIPGRVANIGWGVSSTDLIDLPRGLPYVPKSLDWVRVAQRFPVRIEMRDPPPDLMRVGASAVVRLSHDGDC